MTESYAAAFNSSTNDPWRDPGSLTGTWIVLLGTITFFPTIFVVVFLWNLVMRASSAACCPRVLKIDWIRRIQRDFGHWYGPTAVRPCCYMPSSLLCFFFDTHLILLSIFTTRHLKHTLIDPLRLVFVSFCQTPDCHSLAHLSRLRWHFSVPSHHCQSTI